MERYYYITGYWRDSAENFEDYIVKDGDFTEDQELNDDDVFFYGLSEDDILNCIAFGWGTELEFIITEYKEY